jgi:hypothetical protein
MGSSFHRLKPFKHSGMMPYRPVKLPTFRWILLSHPLGPRRVSHLDPEQCGSKLLWKVRNYWPIDTDSYTSSFHLEITTCPIYSLNNMQNTTYLLLQIGPRRHMHSEQPHTRWAKDYVGATFVLELNVHTLHEVRFSEQREKEILHRSTGPMFVLRRDSAYRRSYDPRWRPQTRGRRLLMQMYLDTSLTWPQERCVLKLLTIRH